jgi:glutamate transport system permease protein
VDFFRENREDVLVAWGLTIEMVVLAGIIALVVGTVLAGLRVSPIPLGRAFGSSYVNTVRNTPLLLIMLLFAFGFPEVDFIPELNFGETRLLRFSHFFIFAASALGLYTAAFVCEAVRSGINSIPLGQAEAARAIGMTFTQSLRHIILPQAFRAVLPPLASALIAMTKNSSVAVGVGVTEAAYMMKKLTNDYTSELYNIFLGFALGYMFLVALIALTASVLERKVRVA